MIHLLFRRLMYYLLPPTKRKNTDGSLMLRTNWWYYLFKPMEDLMSSFHNNRIEYIIRNNVTSQMIVLEWYLKRQINSNIYLNKPLDSGVFVSLGNEGVLTPLNVGLELYSEDGVYIGLDSEFIDVSLIVFVPTGLLISDLERIKIILKQYLFADITYKIEEY